MPPDPLDFEGYIGIGHDVPFPGGVSHWNCRSVQVPVEEQKQTKQTNG
jgi:hypothetical protein